MSNSTNRDLLQRIEAQSVQANEKLSRAFTKLPAQYQNMILVASSQGEVTAMEERTQLRPSSNVQIH